MNTNNIFYIATTANFLQELVNGLVERFNNFKNCEQKIIILPTSRSSFNIKKNLPQKKMINTHFYAIDNPAWLEMVIDSNTVKNKQIILSKQEAVFTLAKFLEEKEYPLLLSMKIAINLLSQYEISIKYSNKHVDQSLNIIQKNQYIKIFHQEFLPYLRENNLLLYSEYYSALVNIFLKSDLTQISCKIIFAAINGENTLYENMLKKILTDGHHIILNYLTIYCKKNFQLNNYNSPDYYCGKFCFQNNIDIKKIEKWLSSTKAKNIDSYPEKISLLENHIRYQDSASVKVFDNQHTEALYIVDILKNIPSLQKTALIVPDENLLKKILSYAKAKQVNIDIFLHNQLNQTDFFNFIKLIFYNLMEEDSSNFLALLKYSYAASGKILDDVYRYELELYKHKFKTKKNLQIQIQDEQYLPINNIISSLSEYELLFKRNHKVTLSKIIDIHLDLIIKLCTENIWQDKEAGAFRNIIEKILEHKFANIMIHTHDFLDVMDIIISSHNFQEQESRSDIIVVDFHHVRLLEYDRYIMAGVNEKNIPFYRLSNEQYLDISIIKSMNTASFALQSQIFFTLLLKNIDITCVRNDNDVPSKWLEMITRKKIDIVENYTSIYGEIKKDNVKKVVKSCIFPPLHTRPKKFSPTSFSYLMRDPYGFYLKYILKIFPIEVEAEDLMYRNWGSLIHSIVQEASHLPSDSLDKKILMEHNYTKYFDAIGEDFWMYKLDLMFDAFEAISMLLKKQHYLEIEGSCVLNVEGKEYIFKAKADYIGIDDQEIEIIDFKTGSVPKLKEVYDGLVPQLGILGMIMQKNGFKTGGKNFIRPIRLYYGKLSTNEGYENVEMKISAEELIKNTEDKIIEILSFYADAEHGYEDSDDDIDYDDYKYIKRKI